MKGKQTFSSIFNSKIRRADELVFVERVGIDSSEEEPAADELPCEEVLRIDDANNDEIDAEIDTEIGDVERGTNELVDE